MRPSQLEGYWLNAHIRELLEKQHPSEENNDLETHEMNNVPGSGHQTATAASTTPKSSLANGEKGPHEHLATEAKEKGVHHSGPGRQGPTSRELSGEMGGDTRA